MRLLHTSDWHLGRVLFDHPLLEDQRQVLGQIIARSAGADAVLVCGDLFDRSLASEGAVRLWSEFLRDFRAAWPELPLLVIAGNHDSAARIAYAADALALAGIHVRGGADGLERPVELGNAAGERMQVWLAPFLWAGDLDGGGDGAVRTQAETLALALERIRPGQDRTALQVLMAHCFTRGGAPSDSERVLVGAATEVEPELFEGFHYVALGHLHRGQRIREHVWYSGSPLPYSFSEARDAKGVLAVELALDRPARVQVLPLAVPRPLRRIHGSLGELLDDPRFQDDTGCLVEVTLPAEAAGANPFQLLKARFPYLCCLGYAPAPGAGAEPAGAAGALRRDGDLLSDFRQFAADIGLESEALDGRAALVARLVQELDRAERA